MQIVTRIIAMSRAVQLGRQLREIERVLTGLTPSTRKRLAELTIREVDAAAQCEFPHLYGTPPEQRYNAWGIGSDIGFNRVKSDNLQVRLRGIALWLAVVFHETRDSRFSEPEQLHRRILGIVRQLKQAGPQPVEQVQRAVA